jgi:ADP-heptose:LPS heptosyltransferase
MRVEFMKAVDRWAGGLGCILLDVFDRPRRFLFPKPDVPANVATLLVTKYLGMGSIVLATPMVAALRRRFPGARVVFLTFASNREIAEILGVFDEVLTIDSKGLMPMGRDTIRALWRLWKLGVDVVCDLEFFTRYSTMVAYLTGAPIRVGYWSRIAWRGNILTHPVYYNGMRHITRVFLAQAEALGANVDEESTAASLPALAHDEEARRSLAEKMRAAGLDPSRPFVMVNPNASELCLERRWMADRFAEVVDSLLAENEQLQAVFVGSSNERSYTGGVLARCRPTERTANLAGELSIRSLVEALATAKLFLTVDSGPLHLAALTKTPTVALFGPETPTLYGGLGSRLRTFYAGVYCSPCLNVYNTKTAPCNGNNICMQAIGATDVLAASRELLREGGERRRHGRDDREHVPSLSR